MIWYYLILNRALLDHPSPAVNIVPQHLHAVRSRETLGAPATLSVANINDGVSLFEWLGPGTRGLAGWASGGDAWAPGTKDCVSESELERRQLNATQTMKVDNIGVASDIRLSGGAEEKFEVWFEGVALNQNSLGIVHKKWAGEWRLQLGGGKCYKIICIDPGTKINIWSSRLSDSIQIYFLAKAARSLKLLSTRTSAPQVSIKIVSSLDPRKPESTGGNKDSINYIYSISWRRGSAMINLPQGQERRGLAKRINHRCCRESGCWWTPQLVRRTRWGWVSVQWVKIMNAKLTGEK